MKLPGLPNFLTSKIARKITLYVVGLSSLITLCATGADLYLDYRSNVNSIKDHLDEIRTVNLVSLTNSVWVSDELQIQTQLDGLLQIQDIEYLGIMIGNKTAWKAGEIVSKSKITHTIPMNYTYRNNEIMIGHLKVVASLDNVYWRLLKRVFFILLSNSVKTFIVASFILFVFFTLVGRHLDTIANYIRNLNPNEPGPLLELDKSMAGLDSHDEIDEVVESINDMHVSLIGSYSSLVESEMRFKDFAESTSDFFWEMDFNLRFSYFSEHFEKITAIPQADLLGKTREETGISNINQDDWAMHLADLKAHREFKNFIHPRVHPNGKMVWLSISGKPFFDENAIFRGFRGTGTDITERRKVEEEFRKMSKAVEQSATQVIITGVDGVIEYVNPKFVEVTGYTAEEAIGNTPRMLKSENTSPEVHKEIWATITSGGVWRGELQNKRKDGSLYWDSSSISPINAPDGTITNFLAIKEDITEHKRAEEQLLHSQRMEAVGQLTGGIAHDFNNLLAVMIGNAALLEDVAGDDEEAKQSIEAIMEAVDRGASLTNRLLAFSRKQALSPVVVNVIDLTTGLADMLRRTLGEMIDLKVEKPLDLWPAMIDPHQFENALVNLAINARDAMPNGGKLTIETANVILDETYAIQHEEITSGDYVEVSVSDTGTGMPPEVLEKVFEPFFTTKEVGKGSGLGLSMVFGFAKQSEGHVAIYSEVGHGTTVKLYLPRSEEDVATEDPKDTTRELARGSERILIVEDDEHVREVPARILRKQGYVVVEARDGKEAIEHLENALPFDLLFTDVVLPGGMSGIEIAERSKSLHPGIKVLLTSGYVENFIAEGINKDLGAALLSKPYPPAKLLEKIRDILDG